MNSGIFVEIALMKLFRWDI